MLKNKKFLIGFLTCASLVLIMAHDYNNNHNHYEYADSYHSHGSDYHSHSEYADSYHTHSSSFGGGNYADKDHDHNYGYNAYAKEGHTHDTGWNTYAEEGHSHDGWNGYAKQTDVSDLEARIEDLESEIRRLRNHDH